MTQRDARLSGALPPLLLFVCMCVSAFLASRKSEYIYIPEYIFVSQQTEIEKAAMYVKVCIGGIGSQMACQRAICLHECSSD